MMPQKAWVEVEKARESLSVPPMSNVCIGDEMFRDVSRGLW